MFLQGQGLQPAFIARVPAPVRGVAWMAVAAAAFAVMINVVRYLTETFDPLQVVFFRNLFGLVAMLPWLGRQGFGALRTRRIGLHLLRAAIGITAMVGWFTTLSLMPLAEATALSFTAPLFTSVLAVIVLGEAMRLRRWTATLVGLLGALIILRPGFESVQPVALLAIATAAVWGTSTVLIKVMARTESAGAIVTWLVLFSTPLSLLPALWVWVPPTLEQLGWCVLLGFAGSMGHVCMVRALANADATLVVPLDYIRLPAVALIAYLVFGQVPDLWTWLGAAVIAASGIYITLREARVKRVVEAPVALEVLEAPAAPERAP